MCTNVFKVWVFKGRPTHRPTDCFDAAHDEQRRGNDGFIVLPRVRIHGAISRGSGRRHLFFVRPCGACIDCYTAHVSLLEYNNNNNTIFYIVPWITFFLFAFSPQFNVRQMMVDSTGMRTDNIKPGTPITSETSSSKNTNDSAGGNGKNSSSAAEKIVPSR